MPTDTVAARSWPKVWPYTRTSAARLSGRLTDSRTPTWNDLATLGSLPSNPPVKTGLMVVMLIALPLLWRRWHTTSAPLRWAARIGAIAMVVTMAVSRLYLGMHHLSDIIGGVALGAVVLAITLWILRRGLADRAEAADAASLPAQTTSLDLSTPQAVAAMGNK